MLNTPCIVCKWFLGKGLVKFNCWVNKAAVNKLGSSVLCEAPVIHEWGWMRRDSLEGCLPETCLGDPIRNPGEKYFCTLFACWCLKMLISGAYLALSGFSFQSQVLEDEPGWCWGRDRGALLGFGLCCDLNLSWGWQRPGDKSLCAWGDQTPLSQHPFWVTQRSLVWICSNCGALLGIAGVHSMAQGWGDTGTLPRRKPLSLLPGFQQPARKTGAKHRAQVLVCLLRAALGAALGIQALKLSSLTDLGSRSLLLV